MKSGARKAAGALYRRAMYLYTADFGFDLALHPGLTIQSPARWSGADEPEAEPSEAFFGYYDKTPWSSDMLRMLLHQRLADGTMTIVVYDRLARAKTVVAKPRVWNWQQGSMTQWLRDGSEGRVIFNDIVDGRLVSRIVSVVDRSSKVVPWPIQCVHPDGRTALALNYCRLETVQPEYGYRVNAANFRPDSPLEADGIWRVDLDTGEAELGLSIRQLMESLPRKALGAQHAVNHFCYSPSGDEVVFLHRWTGRRGTISRLYVANKDLGALRLLLDDEMVSHYSWRDERSLVAWARTAEQGDRYYLIDTQSGQREVIGREILDSWGDGHPSFSPDGRWLLTDSYPDRARQQRLLLFRVGRERLFELGRFHAPWRYVKHRRCDLHPRWSPDGRLVSIDSSHSGQRSSYVLDLGPLISTSAHEAELDRP